MHEDNFQWLGETDLRGAYAVGGRHNRPAGRTRSHMIWARATTAQTMTASATPKITVDLAVTKRTPSSRRRRFEQRAIRNSRMSG
jgi:hypothetical protein